MFTYKLTELQSSHVNIRCKKGNNKMKHILLTLQLIIGLFAFASGGGGGDAPDKILAVGDFESIEKTVEGSFQIVKKKDGKRYLELSKDFLNSEGPGLEILLHKDSAPIDVQLHDYTSLGTLSSIEGKQSYLLSPNVNLDRYKSVVIYCREFHVNFGAAEIIK